MGKKGHLSQAEIWDDTDLQTIWNDSVAEYQKYHSIHARGESVAEVLKAAAAVDTVSETKAQADGSDIDSMNRPRKKPALDAIELHQSEEGEIEEEEYMPPEHVPQNGDQQSLPAAATAPEKEMSMPQATITQSAHDQGLKDLMMSWYWAGYYTGLHEGRNQGRVQEHQNGSHSS